MKTVPLHAGSILEDRYRVDEIIGQGAMGRVYEATDLRIRTQVAIKELFIDNPEFKTAFKREVGLLANLVHPGLPKCTNYLEEKGRCYFVMELITGSSLLDRINQEIPFSVEALLDLADQLLDILEYLHSLGIVHRDIKPSNLKFDNLQRCKLLDFGIAKGAVGDITTVAQDHTFAAATKSYAPLEQLIKSDLEVHQLISMQSPTRAEDFVKMRTDGRTDIYALGATLYHLFTRTAPPPAHLRALSLWAHKRDGVLDTAVEKFAKSKEIFDLIETALRIEPDERFQSAQEMRDEVRRIIMFRNSRFQDADVTSADVDYKLGRIDLFTYATKRYGSESVPRVANVSDDNVEVDGEITSERDMLLRKMAEQIRRAELLGFNDLLEDLKDENFTLNQSFVNRIEKLIDAEIKISAEIENKEVRRKWKETEEREQSRKRAWAHAIRENERVEAQIAQVERETRRRRLLIAISVLALAISIGGFTIFGLASAG